MTSDPTGYILDLFRDGKSDHEIRNELVISGYDPGQAERLIADVRRDNPQLVAEQQEEFKRERKAGSLVTLYCGLGLLIAGTVLMAASYLWRDPLDVWNNPRRLIMVVLGAIGVGGLLTLRGLYELIRRK